FALSAFFCSDQCFGAIVCGSRVFALTRSNGSRREAWDWAAPKPCTACADAGEDWHIGNRTCMIRSRADQTAPPRGGAGYLTGRIVSTHRYGESSMDPKDAANPFADFNKMLEQFRLPGFDVPAVMEARRKDVEALVAANQTALRGMQSLAQQQ